MISQVLYALESAIGYIKKNPQLQFAVLLIVILPIVFLYTSDQFLEAGKSNQAKLQRDRVGLLHDAMVAILHGTEYDAAIIQKEILNITAINPDITKLRIVQQSGSEFTIVADMDERIIGTEETSTTLYQTAAVRFDESLIFPFAVNQIRHWQAVRAIQANETSFFYILSEQSFEVVDSYLAQQERNAYISLILVYLVLLGIAYWIIRLTNYRGLYEEVQAANTTKDMFTNMIAHELRAPLTAMRGYASMISESDAVTSENKNYADRIKSSSERLLAIVNDLLDVARIQSGKVKVQKEAADIIVTVQAVVDELAASAQEKNIALTWHTEDNAVIASFDTKRLHQVLVNIISNSIKYTKEGSILVRVNANKHNFEIRIEDTGMGISAADQKELFAPFFRVNSRDVHNITGTGLGMWITRQFVELMGASIGVESIKGVGTHVVILIPK